MRSRFDFTRPRPRVRTPEVMYRWIGDIVDAYFEDRTELEKEREYGRLRIASNDEYRQMLDDLRNNYVRILFGELDGRLDR